MRRLGIASSTFPSCLPLLTILLVLILSHSLTSMGVQGRPIVDEDYEGELADEYCPLGDDCSLLHGDYKTDYLSDVTEDIDFPDEGGETVVFQEQRGTGHSYILNSYEG